MQRPRNVIVLVADSLRYDSVHEGGPSGLGYTTRESVRFSQARSGGCWTLPATASLFTGLMPHEHGADAQSRGLRPGVPTLAERMREQGYHTAQITANIATTEIFGLDRGFDEMTRIWQTVPSKHRKIHEALVLLGKPRLRKKILSPEFISGRLATDLEASKVWLQNTWDDVFNRARVTLRENERRGKGSFLFLNLMESHFPYHVGDTFETTSAGLLGKVREIVSLYHLVNQTWLTQEHNPIRADMMALLRKRQRRAWERLAPQVDAFIEELHAGGDNLVVFGSDHGDCFGEQGWMYHFSNVADAGNKVPLYWLSPNQEGNRVVDTPVSAKDVFHGILREVGDSAGTHHIAEEPERSYPIMQSAWYNNQGRTLARYKFNQLCFLEGGMRWLYRRGDWYAAPPVVQGPEADFTKLPSGTNPLKEAIVDVERRSHLERVLADFEAFSARHAA
jgi:arylsulfatase A-like enzyme